MIRFLAYATLVVILSVSLALDMRRTLNEEMRLVAVEQACRTIVEAGLVKSCTILRK